MAYPAATAGRSVCATGHLPGYSCCCCSSCTVPPLLLLLLLPPPPLLLLHSPCCCCCCCLHSRRTAAPSSPRMSDAADARGSRAKPRRRVARTSEATSTA